MNTQHRLNRRSNRVRRLQRKDSELAQLAREAASDPVRVAHITTERASIAKALAQYQ